MSTLPISGVVMNHQAADVASTDHLLDPSFSPASPNELLPISPKSTDDVECGEDSRMQSPLEPSASFISCNINLLKTILGAGMLAMPAAFAAIGYVPGILFVLMASVLAAFGLHLFILSSQYVGRGATVSKLANLTYPQLSPLFDLAIAIKCFGVAVSYLIVIGDTCRGIMMGFDSSSSVFIDRRFWLAASALLMIPLAFLKRIDSLKYTSFAGLMSVVYLVAVAVWNYVKPGATRPSVNAGMQPFGDFQLASLKSFSVFVFSFTCHQNILPIQSEAIDNSKSFMEKVIGWCISISTGLYLIFSMISYANFGRVVQGNVFLNYPVENLEMILARILFAFLAAFSYPLQTLPCRNSLESLLPLSKTAKARHSAKIHIALTAIILVGTFTFAFLQEDLSLVLGVIGTLAGIPICYILPFLLYFKLTKGRGWTCKRIAASCLAAFGVVAMIVNSISVVLSIMYTGTT